MRLHCLCAKTRYLFLSIWVVFLSFYGNIPNSFVFVIVLGLYSFIESFQVSLNVSVSQSVCTQSVCHNWTSLKQPAWEVLSMRAPWQLVFHACSVQRNINQNSFPGPYRAPYHPRVLTSFCAAVYFSLFFIPGNRPNHNVPLPSVLLIHFNAWPTYT